MRIIEYSNIGSRAQNQDFVLSKEIGENKAIYIVADGMGGYSDGDIAAKVAAEEIANHIAKGKTIRVRAGRKRRTEQDYSRTRCFQNGLLFCRN